MRERLIGNSALSTNILWEERKELEERMRKATETRGEVIVKVGEERYSVTDPKRAGRQITRLP